MNVNKPGEKFQKQNYSNKCCKIIFNYLVSKTEKISDSDLMNLVELQNQVEFQSQIENNPLDIEEEYWLMFPKLKNDPLGYTEKCLECSENKLEKSCPYKKYFEKIATESDTNNIFIFRRSCEECREYIEHGEMLLNGCAVNIDIIRKLTDNHDKCIWNAGERNNYGSMCLLRPYISLSREVIESHRYNTWVKVINNVYSNPFQTNSVSMLKSIIKQLNLVLTEYKNDASSNSEKVIIALTELKNRCEELIDFLQPEKISKIIESLGEALEFAKNKN